MTISAQQGTEQPPQTVPPTSTAPIEQLEVDERLARMTLEEKIGQVMIVGFDGPVFDAGLQAMIEKFHIGGIILFARNVTSAQQVAGLTNQAQTAALESGHPGLIVAIDQEGGRVARLTEDKGFTEFPSAMAVTATGDLENARQVAAMMAAEMKAVGINTDFAPDLDVNNNPANPVIGIRSFSSDPQVVARYGVAFIQSLQTHGVLAFGKHFPGHGDTGVDSHLALPVIPHDRARLDAVEFVPFIAAMQAGTAGIMSAHVTFPTIDPTPGLAATLSPRVLTDLVRHEMGYDGLLVTDSLEMGALASSGYPVPLAAATALQSGADLLLFNRDHAQHVAAFEMIREWILIGKIPQERLDAAVRRVLHTKARFDLLKPALVDVDTAASQVGTPTHRRLSREIAAQGITLLGEVEAVPISPGESMLVIEPPGLRGLGAALGASFLEINTPPTRQQIEAAISMGRDGRTVIVGTVDAWQSETTNSPEQIELVESLVAEDRRVIIVALRNPYDWQGLPAATACLVTYGANPPALDAVLAVLTGQAIAQGILPVELK